jgi:hypothetical protein
MPTINAQTTPFVAVVTTADTTGNLALQTANVTALTINSSQVVSLANPLPVSSGGTGSTSNATAPFALKGANSDITSLTGLTTALSAAQGGTGVTTGLTALNASNLTSGTVATARLATGTANATSYLRGDQTWATVAVTPAAVSDQVNTSTGAFDLPSGTTAERPGSPSVGMIRYNTTIQSIEQFTSAGWIKITTQIPTLSSITGSIYFQIASNLTLSGTNFGSSALTVRFTSGATTADVSVTPSSGTSLTVAVPSTIFNLANGSTVNIVVIVDGATSNSLSTTILALPTGGTITTSGGYRIHTFTGSGTFQTFATTSVDYLIVAGAGGGGGNRGGGGGAGGMLTGSTSLSTNSYSITIGSGGSAGGDGAPGGDGSSSSALGLTAVGGGSGGANQRPTGNSGGSGGGAGSISGNSGGSGTSGQGNAGGSYSSSGGSGGGKGGAGNTGTGGTAAGGIGQSSSISGSAVTYATGGNGGCPSDGCGSGGSGGANTGNGGGGGGGSQTGGSGGSGVVIIRYLL